MHFCCSGQSARQCVLALTVRFVLVEAYIVLPYMFLMMFFSLVYRFINCIMASMLKHPSSMCRSVGFIWILWKKGHCSSFSIVNQFIIQWIDSSNSLTIYESIHNLLNRFTFESIHLNDEWYHSSSWAHLNRFICTLNRFILHAFLSCLLLSESIHSFSELIHQGVFVRNFTLITPHYI
jgi:hypothetical protein